MAEKIANFTIDCPLATVIAAQIVAKENVDYLELTKNEDSFRETIFARYQDVIAGNIGSKADNESIRKLLKIIALLQPFHPNDKSIPAISENMEGVKSHDANRLIRRLAEAGVLFKRGSKFRLSPDLLSDFIIEDSCIGIDGTSSGYAELLFDIAGVNHIENILVNLGKLDWRLTDRQPGRSSLLDGIWSKLKPTSEYSDPFIRAVTAVAYYQPDRAIDFATRLVHEGVYLRDLPELIKYAAYNFEQLPAACELLWQLGKSDKRQLHQHPGHAIRILAELCEIKFNKPIEYNEAIVDFALSLFEHEEAWMSDYTPFDILKSIVQTEGEETEWKGQSLNFQRFTINPEFVSQSRNRVIETTIKNLSHPNLKIAVHAARFLQETVHYPTTGGARKKWTAEFVNTLNKLIKKITIEELDSFVLIEVARSVSWHANYANNKSTTPLAKKIIKFLPDSLDFRIKMALVDGYGNIFERINFERSDSKWNNHLTKLTNDVIAAYPDADKLRAYIEDILSQIEIVSINSAPYVLYDRLIHSSLSLASATINDALANPSAKTGQFIGTALTKLLNEDHENALLITSRILETNSRDLLLALGCGYRWFKFKKENCEKDITILKTVLTSNDEFVVRSAVQAVRAVAKIDQRLAIDLLKCVDIGMSSKVADDVLIFFQRDDPISFRLISDVDVTHFLYKLMPLQTLDEHWIEVFLSKCSKYHAKCTFSFLKARVENAKNKDWRYRPCNYGPYRHVALRFRDSPDFDYLLREFVQWMKSNAEDDSFISDAAELFEAMFQPFDDEIVAFLQTWLEMATPQDIRIITQILKQASHSFVFDNSLFVIRFLEKSQQCGNEWLDNAISALKEPAILLTRTGLVGKPCVQDIELKEAADKMLKDMPRFSPAYRLYTNLKKYAEQSIESSIRDGEKYGDE